MEASRAGARPRSRKSLRQLAPLRHKRAADPAFEQLYRTHSREVYQYALALLTNPADAEDATQTTFLNAYRAFRRGERPQKPHNWLITITHNVCRMRWRQAGSRPREVALDEAPEPVALDHERPNLDAVLSALARLSFNQRAALVMRELEGRSYQEIAGVLGVSSSAVEALLFRARRRLKLERDALGILSTAPLPGSLTSFFGGGGGAVAVGGGAVLKAAAVVVAGAVTAGAGYQSVQAITGSGAPAAKVRPAPPRQHRVASAGRAQPLREGVVVRRQTRRRAAPTRSVPPAGPSNAPQPSAAPTPPLPLLSTLPLVSTVPLVATVPVPPVTVPKIVPPPPVHVTPPPLPPPPITVTTPTLPPPPIK